MGTASAVLALSKTAWKLGISFSEYDQEAKVIDTTVNRSDLAGEVTSLGNECDLIYAELEEVVKRRETESLPPCDEDGRTWNCLAMQVEETSRTMRELKLWGKHSREEEPSLSDQAECQMERDISTKQVASIRAKICRHIVNLRTTLLLIHT